MAKKKTPATKKPAKKTTAKKATAKKSKKKKSPAKKSVNKSEEIRDYYKTHRSATAKEVQEALAKKGIKVSEPLIYNVRMRAGSKKKTAKKQKVQVSKTTADRPPLEDLKEASNLMIQAVELVVTAGAKEASQLVATASKIVEKARVDD